MSQSVPNRFPVLTPSVARLAVIGEAPHNDDSLATDLHGNLCPTPFTSTSGRLLKSILANCGLASDQLFLGNCQQITCSLGDVNIDSVEFREGLALLRADLAVFKPNCILALGRATVRSFVPSLGRVDKKGEPTFPLDNYRGSIYLAETDIAPAGNNKIVASFDPGYIFRSYADLPLFKFDCLRAATQSRFPEFRRPNRLINTQPTLADVLGYLEKLKAGHLKAAFDIEGYSDNVGVTMLSIAISPLECIVIPFWFGGQHYWPEHEEVEVWRAVASWLHDPLCKKVCQNAAYELFVLAWSHHCRISGIHSDTMFKHFELYPELPKSLGLQTSIYTDEPFYKDERESQDHSVKLFYNGKDSCVTIESDDVIEPKLQKLTRSYSHYEFNVSLIPAVNYMSLRGCKFDRDAANVELNKTQLRIDELNEQITKMLGRSINVKSTPDKQWLLYEFFGFTPYARLGTSTKEEVLLRYYQRERHPLLKLVIDCISVRTRKSDINKLTTDVDGRIRANFNLVGTNTSRISSNESSARIAYFTKTGILKWEFTGTNLQNVTKELRRCFIPDSTDHWFYQLDLSGADGWTVGADLAALGHPTMLEDYLAGIKPAKVLLLMLDEYETGRDPSTINKLDRNELRARTKAIRFPEGRDSQGRAGDWKYLCMKRVQHGTNLDMGPDLLAATIFKDSEGEIDLTNKEAGIYQYLYKCRYNTDARRNYIVRELRDKGYLQCASGFRRQFLSIRNRKEPESDIVRQALATEPQSNTTYVCNKALQNLWQDEENRSPINTLYIEPLLQIHDAMAGQFPRAATGWAVDKLRTYFRNPITIHGINVSIPFEGGYGPNWLHTHEEEFS